MGLTVPPLDETKIWILEGRWGWGGQFSVLPAPLSSPLQTSQPVTTASPQPPRVLQVLRGETTADPITTNFTAHQGLSSLSPDEEEEEESEERGVGRGEARRGLGTGAAWWAPGP